MQLSTMKKWLALAAIVIATAQMNVHAQAPAGHPAGAAHRPGTGASGGAQRPQGPAIGHIYGKLLDATTGKPVPYSSVALLRAKDSSVVTGMLSQTNGDFSLENLPMGAYLVRIDFMGYNRLQKKVLITGQTAEQDLGNIKMSPNVKALAEVEVTGQKSAFQMGIDKKVFNVDRNLVSVGGTATDVLKSVPAVNVDIDGNVTVRNASPNIFVDGKPSTLTLDQIPADAIESVELVTNPSAKYDAEGMSGILNIVLKKNKKAGINGSVNASVSNGNRYNAGGNIAVRQGKWNVFANYTINSNHSTGYGYTHRTNFADSSSALNYLKQDDRNSSKPLFQFGRFGADYAIDNRNTISLSQNIVAGDFKNYDNLLSTFQDAGHDITSLSDRVTNTNMSFRNYTTALNFTHNFAKPSQALTVDANANFSRLHRGGDFITQAQDPLGGNLGQPVYQDNNTAGKTSFITLQSDYTNPIGKNGKLEAGLKTTLRNFTSTYDVYDIDTTTQESKFNPLLSNDYKYSEQIYAGYLNYANTIGKFGYQVGLRGEQYVYSGEIPSANEHFKPTKSRPGLFPSLFLSQKLAHDQELQLNYSRRVTRPNFFQLIPYRDYSDPQNQREGNPNLKPEYTNSFEFSYAKNWKSSNFLATLYYRNTTDLITTVSDAIGKDTLLTHYVNADKDNSYGAELTMKNTIIRGWDVTTNVNLYQTNLTVKSGDQSYSNNGFSWMAKINSETKLPANFTLQVNGTYQAPSVALPNSGGGGGGRGGGGGGGMQLAQSTAQGKIKGFSGVDMAVKKDFLKNKAASLTLALSDVFNTRQYQLTQVTPQFEQDYMRKRESRIVKLTFAYRFGKFDNNLFKRKKSNNQQSDDQFQTF